MDVTELKPCPFCGGNAEMHPNYSAGGIGRDGFYCRCAKCGAEGVFDLGASGAKESWNTRPTEDLLQAEVARLRETGAIMAASIETAYSEAEPINSASFDVDFNHMMAATRAAHAWHELEGAWE